MWGLAWQGAPGAPGFPRPSEARGWSSRRHAIPADPLLVPLAFATSGPTTSAAARHPRSSATTLAARQILSRPPTPQLPTHSSTAAHPSPPALHCPPPTLATSRCPAHPLLHRCLPQPPGSRPAALAWPSRIPPACNQSIRTLPPFQVNKQNQKRKRNYFAKLEKNADQGDVFTSNYHPDTKVMRRPYNKFDLYHVESPQHPNPAHYRKADNILRDPESFTLIDHGRLVLYEKDMSESKPEEKNHKFIAYIEFTPSEELTQEDVHELNFFTRFLRRAQDFIGTVSSTRIFHGTMWTIGWRKAYIHGKILGRYLDTTSAAQDPDGYEQSIQDGLTAGNIVHRLFNTIADKAVTCANNLLNSLGMPAYQDPNLNLDPSKNGFASNLAFTHGGFSNRPHRDDDTSKTAFLMLCNIKKDTGLISLNSHLDPAFLGPFFYLMLHNFATVPTTTSHLTLS
ncbi:hypothetical protein PCASD_05566 [Puccinia coronata f. sp. avenae]|uniref:Tet-like 2OG-Fe(II) oxygenase domain-containing protein n=1 Tax=Puccinia coronata f. sp. avenae TaxID=200324 RepID=A0A2N5UVQ9_9BASI|nr:hypothetical protein PCASD_05566 [Puccinia coronata f. sp. avenae]